MCDVLVLDDDPLVLSVVADLLRSGGLAVEEATNSIEALAWFRRDTKPAVLVTDVNLGEQVDGCDVARDARETAPRLPVVFITGRPDRFWGVALDDRQRLVPKPFRAAELLSAIRQVQASPAV